MTATASNLAPIPPTYSTINLPHDRTIAPSSNLPFGAARSSSPKEKESTSLKDEKSPASFSEIERTGSVDKASYIRDPTKLVAYLIPFPTPKGADDKAAPVRFLIWTPPPPPLQKPKEGEKETFVRKTQRKWQKELRDAKTTNAKAKGYTWKGGKSKVIKAHNWAFNKVTSADLEFVNRIPIPTEPKKDKSKSKAKDSINDKTLSPTGSNSSDDHSDLEPDEETKRALKLQEIVLVYPPSIGLSETQLRTEFIESLARTRSRAQRDAMISTGLLPFSLGADLVLAHVGGPGGFSQINGGWAALSIRGAHNARHITKRLSLSSSHGGASDEHGESLNPLDNLKLVFHPSERVDIMQSYLSSKCVTLNDRMFTNDATYDTDVQLGEEEASTHIGPRETAVLEAIGWEPSKQKAAGGSSTAVDEEEERNWEDEAWERQMVEEDLEEVMKKAAKTWVGWCKSHVKSPKKSTK